MTKLNSNQSVSRPNLVMECGYCHCNNVVLNWKNYLKQYRGMCPNEACEVWTVIIERRNENK